MGSLKVRPVKESAKGLCLEDGGSSVIVARGWLRVERRKALLNGEGLAAFGGAPEGEKQPISAGLG